MTSAAVGGLLATLLAAGFALVGEALPGRASTDLFGWTESFLIGTGTCAALLFPFSFLPGHASALTAEMVLMALCAIAIAVVWRRRPGRALPDPPGARSLSGEIEGIRTDRVAVLLLAGVVFVAAFFTALNVWRGHAWDSVQLWTTRAQMLFVQGGLTRYWFPEDNYNARLLTYPPLIPLFEALLARVRGVFDYDQVKPVFPFFYGAMLISTYSAARAVVSRRWALATVLLLALLPELTTRSAAGGYADMPLAAFVAAVVAAALRSGESDPRAGWRAPLPWLVGSLTTVKSEGVLLCGVACAMVILFALGQRPRHFAARWRKEWTGVLVVAGSIALRLGYLRWLNLHDGNFGPFDAKHWARVLESLTLIVRECLRYLLEPWTWGLFWPAFFVAAGVLAVSVPGALRLKLLALATGGAVALYAAIFLFTNWDFQVHIAGAYTRLLAQIAPAAAVVIGAAGSRIWTTKASAS